MIVTINTQPVECEIQNEKNISDVLAVLEDELQKAGQTITGIAVNGTNDNNGTLFDELSMTLIKDATTLDITVESTLSLFAFALTKYEHCIASSETDKSEHWKRYIALYDEKTATELHTMEQADKNLLTQYIESVLAMIGQPKESLTRVLAEITEVIPQMSDVAVLFQTGKDSAVMNAITHFSSISDTFIRILRILKLSGCDCYPATINETPIEAFMSDYNVILQDFLTALSQNDTVLTGDLAEYEIVPRLESIINAFTPYAK